MSDTQKHPDSVLAIFALILLDKLDQQYEGMVKDGYVDTCLQVNQYLRNLVKKEEN